MRWILRIVGSLAGMVVLLLLAALAFYVYASMRVNGELISSGTKRKFLLHVPARYTPSTQTPLVISLHGAYLYPRFQQRLTRWDVLADQEGFLVVYPKAAGLPPLWGVQPGPDLTTEVQFFTDLIDHLSTTYNIDPSRIYVNGFSNGAAMTMMLSCNLADRVAAFGVVATPVVPWEWCESSTPVPVIAVHGTADPFAPYQGGENFLTTEPLQSIEAWAAELAARNGCSPQVDISSVHSKLSVTSYGDCERNADVMLYSVADAGHVWPGGLRFPGNFAGANRDELNATSQLWAFFQEHPLAP